MFPIIKQMANSHLRLNCGFNINSLTVKSQMLFGNGCCFPCLTKIKNKKELIGIENVLIKTREIKS